jgi:hypothetical protein
MRPSELRLWEHLSRDKRRAFEETRGLEHKSEGVKEE